ncbi:hypothetical protein Lal_00028324 [Lupinus albus]|nr:hypothetical protein Lal_00028324 [Lupinus albus]
MAHPPTPPGPRERTLRELVSSDFTPFNTTNSISTTIDLLGNNKILIPHQAHTIMVGEITHHFSKKLEHPFKGKSLPFRIRPYITSNGGTPLPKI